MPGPCSAPNGQVSIVNMKRDKGQIVKSGKTALKRGKIEHARMITFKNRMAKARAQSARAEREAEQENI